MDQDLDDCIDQGFDKLDIRAEFKIPIKSIEKALFSSFGLNHKTSVKQILKTMQRHLNDSQMSCKNYSKQTFHSFILSCLRPDRLASKQSAVDKI